MIDSMFWQGGAVSTAVLFPLEVIKTRIQAATSDVPGPGLVELTV
jgi:hypothetical protein